MTQTNSVVGTAQYLSPEQARGEVVDARSDLYSTGCLLFELLTGQPPFRGDSAVAVAYQHVRESPRPPSAVNPDVSRYVDAVMIRAYEHATIEEFARYSTVPVINGLSDRLHPCQVLADIMTLSERFGDLRGLKLAWIGDGNNVCNSWILSSILTGMEIAVASPPGYRPKDAVVDQARAAGSRVSVVTDPEEAVRDADVLYTDIWVSMGDERERAERLRALKRYTIDSRLLARAPPNALVMHCLPAHRGEEITDEVMEGSQSIVWDQAENRLHAQKALLLRLIAGGMPSAE